MEMYFKISNKKVIEAYELFEKNEKLLREAFRQISEELEIESNEYAAVTDRLRVRLSEDDIKRFEASLMKGSSTDFKRNSKESKRWRELMAEKNIDRPRRPQMWNYLPTYTGEMSSNIVKIDNQLYGYYQVNNNGIKINEERIPEGFNEIKAWEYHKAIDEYNERLQLSLS